MIRLLASAAHRMAEAAVSILAATRGMRTPTPSAGRLPRLPLLAVVEVVAAAGDEHLHLVVEALGRIPCPLSLAPFKRAWHPFNANFARQVAMSYWGLQPAWFVGPYMPLPKELS